MCFLFILFNFFFISVQRCLHCILSDDMFLALSLFLLSCFFPRVIRSQPTLGQGALQGQSVPDGCPPGRMFVLRSARSSVLTWGHTSRLACHPGVQRTLALIQQPFWWPSMAVDVRTHRPSTGLLQPFPIPPRPWSHIALDFVTGLLPSEGNETILT